MSRQLCPSNEAWPSCGSSTPAISDSRLLLPQPLGPCRNTRSPAAIRSAAMFRQSPWLRGQAKRRFANSSTQAPGTTDRAGGGGERGRWGAQSAFELALGCGHLRFDAADALECVEHLDADV